MLAHFITDYTCLVLCECGCSLDLLTPGVKTDKAVKLIQASFSSKKQNTGRPMALEPGVLQSKHSQTANQERRGEEGKVTAAQSRQTLCSAFSQQPAISL